MGKGRGVRRGFRRLRPTGARNIGGGRSRRPFLGPDGDQDRARGRLFFDNFVGNARQTFTFRFDPARTHGFVAVGRVRSRLLCQRGPAARRRPGIHAQGGWLRLDGAHSRRRVLRRNAVKPRRRGDGGRRGRIVITPGKASLTVDGAKLAEGKIKVMENVERLCRFASIRMVARQPARLLRAQGNHVDRVAGALREPEPAPGVAGFSEFVLFGPKAKIEWEGDRPQRRRFRQVRTVRRRRRDRRDA